MFGFLAMLSHLASAKLVLPAKVRPKKTCSWDNGIEEREHIMLFFELWNKRVYAFLCCPIVAWNVNNMILEQKYGTMQPNKGINFLFLCRVINLFFLTPHLLFPPAPAVSTTADLQPKVVFAPYRDKEVVFHPSIGIVKPTCNPQHFAPYREKDGVNRSI